jgi:hypothetical protein
MFFITTFSKAQVKENKDTTIYKIKNNYFIGLNCSSGIGWRNYNNSKIITETIYKVQPKKEIFGLAYSFGIKMGLAKKMEFFFRVRIFKCSI